MADRNLNSKCCNSKMLLSARILGYEAWRCTECDKMWKYKLTD